MAQAVKMYEYVGISDDVTNCECCGRTELKCTVALRNTETREIVRYGRTCAARALGWTLKEFDHTVQGTRKAMQEAETARKQAYDWAIKQHPLMRMVEAEITAFYAASTPPTWAEREPMIRKWHELERQAQEEIGPYASFQQ